MSSLECRSFIFIDLSLEIYYIILNSSKIVKMKKTYYLIYKTTNQINSKFYIGKRVTKNPNDNYTGSGKAIKRAVKKYGKENFSKKILFYLNDKEEMAKKEAEIVTEDLVNDPQCYNIRLGGKGGFTKEEARKGRQAANIVGAHIKGGRAAIKKFTAEQRSRIGKKGGNAPANKNKSEEHRQKLSKALKGKPWSAARRAAQDKKKSGTR